MTGATFGGESLRDEPPAPLRGLGCCRIRFPGFRFAPPRPKSRTPLSGLPVVRPLIVALTLSSWMGCSSSDNPNAPPGSLIELPGAQKVRRVKNKFQTQLSYELEVKYPAKVALDEILDKVKKSGWTPLSEDYLNPGLPSSHVRGWSDYDDLSKQPPTHVYQWLAQWKNANGDILWYVFYYRDPLTATSSSPQLNFDHPVPDSQTLQVIAFFVPRKEAEESLRLVQKQLYGERETKPIS